MHIAIAGNIGSGKTTLTNKLAQHYSWLPQFETVEHNPYLEDYYRDMKRWAFALEVFFLKQRFRDMLDIAHSSETIIQDRTIYEGVYVFAANNYDMGNMSQRDFETYMQLFQALLDVIKWPDLMIYLKASVPHLVSNIQRRRREYEQTIPLDYLTKINQRYDDFIYGKYQGEVLVVDVDNLDFQHSPEHFRLITDKIDARLFGLFSNDTFTK